MIAATTALISQSEPSVGSALGLRMRMSTAATPASRPAKAKAPAITRLARTPISRAASKSSLAARTEMPNSVRRNTNAVSAQHDGRRRRSSRGPSPRSGCRRPRPCRRPTPGPANDFLFGDTKTAQQACDSCSRANEVSSIVNGLALRTQRKATRSVATDASDGGQHDRRREQPPPDALRRQEVGDVGADGDQLGVGEVDEVHDAEDQRDAEGQQGVRAASPDAVDEVLDAARSWRRPRRSGRTGPRGRRARGRGPRRRCGRCAARSPRSAISRARRAFCSTTSTVPPPCAQLDEQVEHDVDHAPAPGRASARRAARCAARSSAPGHGELLGLAAGQVAGGGVPPVVEHGEAGAGLVEPPAAFGRPGRDAGQLEVLADGEVAEDAPALGHQRQPGPDEARRLGAGDVDAASATRPPAGRTSPATVLSSVVLPAPFGPTSGDELALVDVQRRRRGGRRPRRSASSAPRRRAARPVTGPGRRTAGRRSVNAGSPSSTVRMTTSFWGTPLVPA